MLLLTRLGLTTLLLAVGCATTSTIDEVRKIASARFDCSFEETSAREAEIGVRDVTYDLGMSAFVAEGCGQRMRIECREENGQLICPQNVQVEGTDPNPVTVAKSDPPANCKDLGPIQAMARRSSYEALYRKFKDEVRNRGGNYGRLDGQQGSILRGVAFACPLSSSQAP